MCNLYSDSRDFSAILLAVEEPRYGYKLVQATNTIFSRTAIQFGTVARQESGALPDARLVRHSFRPLA